MSAPIDLVDDLVILGAGPAGYTAAIYASRAGLKPRLICGMQPGGQLTTTTDVENWPGDVAVSGPALVERMAEHAQAMGAVLEFDEVDQVDLQVHPFNIRSASGKTRRARALVIATGARARWLGIESEQAARGKGVSACATCDGFFFRGKRVVVVGGGNTAVEEALYLSKLAQHVTLVHRRNSLRAERILQTRLQFAQNIECRWSTEVSEVITAGPQELVTAVRLKHLPDGSESIVPTDGMFVAIGHEPATQLFRNQLVLDSSGYIVTEPGTTRTSVDGVFAAGDVQDPVYRQAITAAATGCMAALDAEKYFAQQHSSR